MNGGHIWGSFVRYVCIQDVSVFQLSTYKPDQIKGLSGRIAAAHKEYIAKASLADLNFHINSTLEFGVTLGKSKAKTLGGQCQRLADQEFWCRRLTQISDRTRESIAVRNQLVGVLQPYCSSESFECYLDRQSKRSANTLNRLQRQMERAANQQYLITKAASERAFEAGYLSVFITLGLDGRYHSSSPSYEGRTFDDGYKILHQMHDALLENLSQYGRRGEDFYGARCVEVHVDGCPHFHTVLYIQENLLPHLTRKLRELHYKQSVAMALNFDKNVDKIIQVRQAKDCESYGEAVSYVFKNSYSGRKKNNQSLISSLRQKAVIGIYGKHQYELIGMNGSASVIKEIPKHKDINEIAGNLGFLAETKDRRATWLKVIKKMIAGGASQFRIVKENRENRYGEIVKRTVKVVYAGIDTQSNARCVVNSPVVICNYSRCMIVVLVSSLAFCYSVIICDFRIRAPPIVISCQTQV